MRGRARAALGLAAALPAALGTVQLEVWSGVSDPGGACGVPSFPPTNGTKDGRVYSVSVINQTATTDNWVLPTADEFILQHTTYFAARWTGYLYVESAGTYMFATESDDSSELAVDDSTIVRNGPECRSGTNIVATSPDTNLTIGWHKLVATYYQYTGSAGMSVRYKGPDSGEEEVVIPASVLYEKPWKPSGLSDGPIGRAIGGDYVQPPRTLTKRWINFHPTVVNLGETVKFTFTGFWASSMVGRLRVRLTESEDCVPVYVHYGNSEKLEQLTIDENRTATFLMPRTANQVGAIGSLGTSWAGGFCFYINERWQVISQPLVAQTPPAETAALMRGYQSCHNYVQRYKPEVDGLCGCFFENMMDQSYEFADMPSTIPMTFDNNRLKRQNVKMFLMQGCCNRWTQKREAFTLTDTETGQRQSWGWCAGKTGASQLTDYITPAPTTLAELDRR
eukprot:TRINITY_DN55612_c0_g1_i1.p1 TRINITY_DN55612_c0_g1~~TRINITY_DN55612_c0_g1_i1.p1  ORF type:complete len:481 (+),score=164.89 TRINITY_DN55612_c0_g1_i1:91-1443(+)